MIVSFPSLGTEQAYLCINEETNIVSSCPGMKTNTFRVGFPPQLGQCWVCDFYSPIPWDCFPQTHDYYFCETQN